MSTKSAKASAGDGTPGSSRRAQPIRQTRTNPPRTNSSNRTHPHAGGPLREQQIEIFPAITHFADAITALPKELVRHFTLLKEVDAKICGPNEELFRLIQEATADLQPDASRFLGNILGAPLQARLPAAGSIANGDHSHHPAGSSANDSNGTAKDMFDPSGVAHRQRFLKTAMKMNEMLTSLEEKNHVISTANDALEKQLGRIDELWPHLENEFSDEAKWGSTTHWAYLENRTAKANNSSQAERSRREGAATLSAAAQQLADEAAARSSDRKKAIADKRNAKNQSNDIDADTSKSNEQGRKPQGGSKSRKPHAESAPVGLGISSNSTPNGSSAVKRRKIETSKGPQSAPMERALSGVMGSNAVKPKIVSPREPAHDGPNKKRKALPTSNNPTKKNRTAAAVSPSITSSPVISCFPENTRLARASPAPSIGIRPASGRARQNSLQSNFESTRSRPSPAIPPKPNGAPLGTPDISSQSNGTRSQNDGKAADNKEVGAGTAAVPVEAPNIAVIQPPPPVESTPNPAKKDAAAKASEDRESKRESATPVAPPITIPVTTKSGRTSKPSTPLLATFSEAASMRPRPSRIPELPAAPPKRSHKKGASISAANALAAAQAAQAAAEADARRHGRNQRNNDDDDEDEGDEPRYCYCNGVSYGEMVACDADSCPREWFHLECVGMRIAPKGNTKWFCDDCKKRGRVPDKKVNGK